MNYLPLVYDIKGRDCVVVGGGEIALRKASILARAGAKIRLIALSVVPQLHEIVSFSGGELIKQAYDATLISNAVLVVAATDCEKTNQQVSDDAKQRNMLVNVVDNPALCNVIFPAIVDRAPLLVAISSSGEAPVLARAVRASIESSVPANIGHLAHFIGERRSAARAVLDERSIRSFWESVVDSEVAERVMLGQLDKADSLYQQRLNDYAAAGPGTGEVYLVGAGPGDPDLLTFKALRLMQRADVVLHDRLVSSEIIDMCRRDAERIYVGKARNQHAVPQEEINRLIIELALDGKKVLRLKGGDPFVFGRGGEEIAGLTEKNIPFQVVPGISAANGCACYAGIPLTHRDHAQSVRFVTGQLKDGGVDLPWAELIAPQQTLVIYMALQSLPLIVEGLMHHGAAPDTPVALIERGTTVKQKNHLGTLQTIVALLHDREVHAPTLIIVGSVVSLHQDLHWNTD